MFPAFPKLHIQVTKKENEPLDDGTDNNKRQGYQGRRPNDTQNQTKPIHINSPSNCPYASAKAGPAASEQSPRDKCPE
jgi:hypothetical protein